jgi:hypothetical protein
MKKIFIASLLIFCFTGCKSTTEPQNENKLGSSVTVTSTSSPSLDGGGRWFAGADTGVWYDVDAGYSLQNSSGSVKDITYTIVIGEFKNGKYQSPNGDLFYDGDSTASGSFHLPANSTQILHLQNTLGVGRKNSKDWSYPYGARVTLIDKATNESLVLDDSLSGSTIHNRFKGIIFTTEASSDSLGILDGVTDDGEWKIDNVLGGLEHCFPNPTTGSTTERIDLPQKDSISLTINKTKRTIIRTIFSALYDPGTYDVDVVDSSLKYGMYRIYGHIFGAGQSVTSYGNVMFRQ